MSQRGPEEKVTGTAVTVVEKPVKVTPIYETKENLVAYNELLTMLRYRRPAGSKTERKFIHEFLHPLGDPQTLRNDKFGNYYMRIGDAPIMWSCHTDTVHLTKGTQELGWCKNEVGIAAEEPVSNCLGADDTAGVWLMVQMIRAQRPGLYVFHRAEEIGCKGSGFIVKNRKDIVEGIKFAIALDRKGFTDVITHQRSQRCCSDEFAKSLAAELGMGYRPDDGGVYTDTAEYTGLIPECTNISVGYAGAHTQFERLNLDFIFKLRDALLKLDASKLVEHRKAGSVEYKRYTYSGSGGWGGDNDFGGTSSTGGKWVEGVWIPNRGVKFRPGGAFVDGVWYSDPSATSGVGEPGYKSAGKSWWEQQKDKEAAEAAKKATAAKSEPVEIDDDFEPTGPQELEDMIDLVKRNPEACADILEQFGMGPKQLCEEIASIYGVVKTKTSRWQ